MSALHYLWILLKNSTLHCCFGIILGSPERGHSHCYWQSTQTWQGTWGNASLIPQRTLCLLFLATGKSWIIHLPSKPIVLIDVQFVERYFAKGKCSSFLSLSCWGQSLSKTPSGQRHMYVFNFVHCESFTQVKVHEFTKVRHVTRSSHGWGPAYNGLLRDLWHWSDVSKWGIKKKKKKESKPEGRKCCWHVQQHASLYMTLCPPNPEPLKANKIIPRQDYFQCQNSPSMDTSLLTQVDSWNHFCSEEFNVYQKQITGAKTQAMHDSESMFRGGHMSAHGNYHGRLGQWATEALTGANISQA